MIVTIVRIIVMKTSQLLCGVLLIAVFNSPLHAQEGVDDRGVRRGFNVIEGRIFYPSGRPLDKRLKITLQSINVTDGFSFSNDHGEFIFRKLTDGTYRITIDAGKEYETHNETVNIIDKPRRRGDETETTWPVTIFLKPKANSIGVNATVNASLANVPKPALEIYEKAAKAAKYGDTKKAISFLEEAILIYPQFAEAYKELGFLCLSSKNLEKSVKVFGEAVKIEPNNFTYRFNLGYALLENDKPAEAKEELLKAIALNNTLTGAHILLARAQMKLKDHEGSEKTLNNVISNGGVDTGIAYKMLSTLYEDRNDLVKAVEYLNKYLNLPANDRDVSTRIKLSKILIIIRQLDDAEKNLLKIVKLGSKELNVAYRYLGALYIEKSDPVNAIKYLEKYLEITPHAKDGAQIRGIIEDLRRQKT